jgi:hypothetical protein
MFEFSVNKDMTKRDRIRKVVEGKVAGHLCLTLIIKELNGRVVTTLNIFKHYVSCIV